MPKKSPLNIAEIRSFAELPISELKQKLKNAEGNKKINTALAMCVTACEKAMGFSPFDEQLIAAYALYSGKIIEMATGEGKTISAVFAAFLYTLDKRNIHILTFNDYLAKRDYEWMGPIYSILGVDIGFIVENSSFSERKKAYGRDVIYSTVKECGFDYLKDFIAEDEKDIVQSKLDSVIIDEADSIMIDIARVPLVIAGSYSVSDDCELHKVYDFVKILKTSDYNISIENKNVYLTDSGIDKAENYFETDNLFDDCNSGNLPLLFDCLKAEFYLKENKDYIVKENEIQIIDEYTGRAAKNRHYPGTLQSAVEVKHGLNLTQRGVVMGSVPIQYFIRQYKTVTGMTGTALAAEEEFELLYGLTIEKIPTHIPSRRIDYPMEVYFNDEIKWKKIAQRIINSHKKNQPVLIGTSSISETETLAEVLKKNGVESNVLNAKNDEMEAEIIKNAGELSAVTISTNMAGRGVDILLGGKDGSRKNEVIETGGLLVINTSMRENARMNYQLSGRAGRQGDSGESILFTSLDDSLMQKHKLDKLIPQSHKPTYTEEKITDKSVIREIERIQRISEGDTLDERKNLLKFTAITEKHREIIFGTRLKYLKNIIEPDFWQKNSADDYEKAIQKFGKSEIDKLQKSILLNVINDEWCRYLEFTEDLRSGIHLRSVGGKNPSEEFNIASEDYFSEIENRVVNSMNEYIDKIIDCNNLNQIKITRPKNIKTFLTDDKVEELVKKPFLANMLDTEDEKIDQNILNQTEKKPSFLKRVFGKRM